MLDDEVVNQPNKQQFEESNNDYTRLRTLLLGKDYESIIKQRVSLSDTQRVADVISEAFELRTKNDNSLSRQLAPIIESSIDASIRENPKRIANIIFPIIGPAVRKAVARAVSDMIYSLNYLLQQSLSTKSLIWRYKAWRLGIPYGQYVFLKSIHYRVEQIFFIHKETGILLQSCSAPGVVYQDPDLVSSMLTAITDFMSDSFAQQSDELKVIQLSDLTLLIEPGPHCVVAFAVRGAAGKKVKLSLSELVEKLQGQYRPQLESFEGDITDFDDSHKKLREHLHEKVLTKEKQKPWYSLTLISMIFIFIGGFSYQLWQKHSLVGSFIQTLKQEQGYQLIEHQFANDKLVIDLLRSPQAKHFTEIKQDYETLFIEKGIELILHEKLAAIAQAEHFLPLLHQKYQVNFEVKDSQDGKSLIASGNIRQDLFEQLKVDPVILNSFAQLNTENLKLLASKSEMQSTREQIYQLIEEVNSSFFYFDLASDVLTEESHKSLSSTIRKLQLMLRLQEKASIRVIQIVIIGYADQQGPRSTNQNLSEQRAKLVANMLTANNITENLIVSWGLGVKDLKTVPKELQRRVSIQILSIAEPGVPE